MAILYAMTAVIGFAPNSLAIITGALPVPPLLVHVHAALMMAWLFLLVCQTILVGSGNRSLHRRLGIVSVFLVPSMLLVMAILVVSTFDADFHPCAIGLIQFRRLAFFPAFWAIAMLLRRTDQRTHKRLQLWATLVLLDAALLRMRWLPDFASENIIAVSGTYVLLLAVPMIVYDLCADRRIHKANVVAFILVASTSLAASILW